MSEKKQKEEAKKNKPAGAVESAPKGTVKTIQVDDKIGFLAAPDRFAISTALGHIMKLNGNPDWISAGEAILLQCWIKGHGDNELKDQNSPYFVPACMQAVALLEAATGTLKKK